MENRWDDTQAQLFAGSDLQTRVYTSRLLGSDSDLVLHGGGNTSVKVVEADLFGEQREVLYVKGSGWDLETIETEGFSPVSLSELCRLVTLARLTDTEMTRELKSALTNPAAPSPSVEAILHALIPFKYVDHTHADAIVAISNTPNGEQVLREICGENVLILPYAMPGFVLAKQVYQATQEIDWQRLEGIVLLHHGVFTFDDDARISYGRMIGLVSKAEQHLIDNEAFTHLASGEYEPTSDDYLTLAGIRRRASMSFGFPMISRWKRDKTSTGYSLIDGVEELATRGPLTPDHVLRTKRLPAILTDDPVAGVEQFESDYLTYFERNTQGDLTCLDPAPRYAVWQGKGCLLFGANQKEVSIISDIVAHTLKAVQWGEALGGWRALSEREIFDIEYWELEQAKLNRIAPRKAFDGKVVVITGAASGIGRASADNFISQGAAVVALDINPEVAQRFDSSVALGIVCDVTRSESIVAALRRCVETFGGIDVVVSNAGVFPPSAKVDELADDELQRSLDVNFLSHVKLIRECTPYLRLGFEPTVIIIASKNVPAPGPGAGAYSAAKAALTQIARVAALELGDDGIRVNTVHPNAVFDTGVWTDEVLLERAEHYGIGVDEYKRANVLRTTITSKDVAQLVVTLAGPAFAKTTGAQIPIDGGNERVI